MKDLEQMRKAYEKETGKRSRSNFSYYDTQSSGKSVFAHKLKRENNKNRNESDSGSVYKNRPKSEQPDQINDHIETQSSQVPLKVYGDDEVDFKKVNKPILLIKI